MVVGDDGGDDGSGVCFASPQTLPSDHDYAPFGDSSLDTMRSCQRWWWKW